MTTNGLFAGEEARRYETTRGKRDIDLARRISESLSTLSNLVTVGCNKSRNSLEKFSEVFV